MTSWIKEITYGIWRCVVCGKVNLIEVKVCPYCRKGRAP